MFTKNQSVRINKDTIGFSDLEASAPIYGTIEHVYADGTVQVAYEMCDRHTFMDHAIVDADDVDPSM